MAKKKNDVEKVHELYGASSSDRWLNCPGSIELSKKAPPQPESAHASEGTDGHACLEMFNKSSVRGWPNVRKFLLNTYPKDMVDHAQDAAEYLQSRIQPGDEFAAEEKIKLDHISKQMGGTFDAKIVRIFDRLIIFDYKYGAGVVVHPKDNTQMIMYALGEAKKHDYLFKDIELVIIQPRAEDEEGETIRSWVLSIDELMEWEQRFRDGVKECEKPKAKLVEGDHCRWCPAKAICPEVSKNALAQAQADFDDSGAIVVPKKWELFTNDQIGVALQAFLRVEEWIDAVRAHAFDRANRGQKIPGWKLVAKRSTRKWTDPEKIARVAKTKYGVKAFSEPELLSPAQLEKAIGKKKVEQFLKAYTSQVSSGLTLVPEKDARHQIDSIERDFDEIPQQDRVSVKRKKANGKK